MGQVCVGNPEDELAYEGEKKKKLGLPGAETYIVEINVDATKVCEHKVSNGVGTLNWEVVPIEGLEEPRVFNGNEFARFFVCP